MINAAPDRRNTEDSRREIPSTGNCTTYVDPVAGTGEVRVQELDNDLEGLERGLGDDEIHFDGPNVPIQVGNVGDDECSRDKDSGDGVRSGEDSGGSSEDSGSDQEDTDSGIDELDREELYGDSAQDDVFSYN